MLESFHYEMSKATGWNAKSSITYMAQFIKQYWDSPEARNQAWAVTYDGTQTLKLLSCGHSATLGGREDYFYDLHSLGTGDQVLDEGSVGSWNREHWLHRARNHAEYALRETEIEKKNI